jgi:SAM-dependent methyltransferase
MVRERAVKYVLDTYYPNFNKLTIHQSSPAGSLHELLRNVPGYSYSHFYNGIENGSFFKGVQCANLEKLPFPENSYDIFLTMDVFEHLFNPEIAIKEIYRVLKPGGVYIMTVPIENLDGTTEKACTLDFENKIVHIPTIRSKIKNVKIEYHGNPVDNKGSVVTHYYGYDIINMIETETKFKCRNYFKEKAEDINKLGILGIFKDVFVCEK